MDVERAFIARLAYDLNEPFVQHGEGVTGERLLELRDMLLLARGQDIPVKSCPTRASARVTAAGLRASLGSDFVVEVDEHGIISARARAVGEPIRCKHALRFDSSRWLTTQQAMETLGLSDTWLATLVARGVLTRHHFGKRVLYRRIQVEQLRARRAVEKKSTG